MKNKTTPMNVLIVEDDDILCRAIGRALKEWSQNISVANTLIDARSRLKDDIPDLVILDVNLPDGSGVELAKEIAQLHPMPVTIAISGEASPEQAFQLKEYGVKGYLSKPLSLTDLNEKINELMAQTTDITPHVSSLVGHASFKDVNSEVRKTMVIEALSKAKGNKTQAGAMLNITRQAVQQMINDFEIDIDQFA